MTKPTSRSVAATDDRTNNIPPFSPYILDIRSLALFRILLGLYLLYDIASHLQAGKYSIAWYTSEPQSRSILASDDTPHKSPFHQIWFYRGSANLQIIHFTILGLLSLAFLVGYTGQHFHNRQGKGGLLKVFLWIVLVALQNKSIPLSDGSDAYLRHLLLWCCWLPLTEVWSIDAWSRTNLNSPKTEQSITVKGLACLGITLQIVLMYLGTVLHRTVDRYSWSEMHQCVWLPPKLTAVHYIMNGLFASRKHWFADLIRTTPALSQGMTASAILIEFVAPILCFILGSSRYWAAFTSFQLHLGLYMTMNLPNWQFVGMISQVLWIPPHVWDRILSQTKKHSTLNNAHYKKTDGDDVQGATKSMAAAVQPSNWLSKMLQYFFFIYMIYNFTANRGWLSKIDNGDIGEGLRISQTWLMYETVIDKAEATFLTGITAETRERFDLHYHIRHHRQGLSRLQVNETTIVDSMTYNFPDPRWERALSQWAYKKRDVFTGPVTRMLETLCTLVNEDQYIQQKIPFEELELHWMYLQILPLGSDNRFHYSNKPDNVITVACKEETSESRQRSSSRGVDAVQ